MSKKKTFEAEDVHAVERATAHSNHPDHHGEAVGTPEMGTNKRAKGSARSAAGEGISARERGAEKKLPKSVQKKAHDFTKRSENGQADPEGGY
jgi:hypothetical protein